MKTTVKLLSLLCLVGILFTHCSKDDDDSPEVTKGYLTIDKVKHNLKGGNIIHFGKQSWYEGYRTSILLYSDGISIDEDGIATGKGHYIHLAMQASKTELDNREYIFSSEEPQPIGTIYWGSYVNIVDEEQYDNIVGGKLKVDIKGDRYSTTMNLTTEKGKSISGFYEGKLQYSKGEFR